MVNFKPKSFNSVLEYLKDCLAEIPDDIAAKIKAGYTSEKLSDKVKVVLIVSNLLEIAVRNNWQLIRYEGSYYVYTGTHWEKVEEDIMNNFLCDAAVKMGFNEDSVKHFTFRESLVKQFHTTGVKVMDHVNRKVTKVNLANGTLSVNEKGVELHSHSSEDMMLYKLKTTFDSESKAPIFFDYLDRVLPDKCKQDVLAEFIGYAFCPASVLKLEKCMVLYGGGANGKSVFFEIMQALFGSFNLSNFSIQSLTDKTGYARANMVGKLLNYASELSNRMDTSIFKMIVSGEPVEARHIYGRPFMIHDLPKLMFNTNELPHNVENNSGFFRRFIIVHFDQTIPEEERDPLLAKRIVDEELSGVLNWVLEGLDRLLKNKEFSNCDFLKESILEFKRQHDPVRIYLDDIKAEKAELSDFKIPLKKLFIDYIEYCKLYGYKGISLHLFSKRIQELDFEQVRRAEGRYVGIYIPSVHGSQKKLFDFNDTTTLEDVECRSAFVQEKTNKEIKI